MARRPTPILVPKIGSSSDAVGVGHACPPESGAAWCRLECGRPRNEGVAARTGRTGREAEEVLIRTRQIPSGVGLGSLIPRHASDREDLGRRAITATYERKTRRDGVPTGRAVAGLAAWWRVTLTRSAGVICGWRRP